MVMTQYTFIDTHCHLDFPPFISDMPHTLVQAKASGVEKIIVPAVDSQGFQSIIQLVSQYEMLYGALGLHPMAIAQHNEQDVCELQRLLEQQSRKIIAIGEIGLDSVMIEPHLDEQISLFQRQLAMAKEMNLPIILHARRTHQLIIPLLKKYQLAASGVIHGFAGSYEQALEYIKLGFYIGVGGVITYQRAHKTRQAIRRLPLDRLVLETDAPDMPVFGYQGQPNRPERIRSIFESLVELRQESAEYIAKIIYMNSYTLFF